jgi:tetratricopeptide (TPR) repeat protein
VYELRVEDSNVTYHRKHVFRGDLDFRYQGVLHEVLVSSAERKTGRIEGLVYRRNHDGARSTDPQKYRKDAAVLAAALETDQGNTRYAYYLAQSLRDAGDFARAAAAYERRAAMGGWEEEVYSSLYERAKLVARMGGDADEVVAAMLRAFERRPSRAEPLCEAARVLREAGRPAAAYPFARGASGIPRPPDILFVEDAVYSWRALDELAVSAYWAGRYREAMEVNGRLLANPALPAGDKARVQKNLAFCREKVGHAKPTKK